MAPFTSSAINKSGKTFAPKVAARRRPASKPAPKQTTEPEPEPEQDATLPIQAATPPPTQPRSEGLSEAHTVAGAVAERTDPTPATPTRSETRSVTGAVSSTPKAPHTVHTTTEPDAVAGADRSEAPVALQRDQSISQAPETNQPGEGQRSLPPTAPHTTSHPLAPETSQVLDQAQPQTLPSDAIQSGSNDSESPQTQVLHHGDSQPETNDSDQDQMQALLDHETGPATNDSDQAQTQASTNEETAPAMNDHDQAQPQRPPDDNSQSVPIDPAIQDQSQESHAAAAPSADPATNNPEIFVPDSTTRQVAGTKRKRKPPKAKVATASSEQAAEDSATRQDEVTEASAEPSTRRARAAKKPRQTRNNVVTSVERSEADDANSASDAEAADSSHDYAPDREDTSAPVVKKKRKYERKAPRKKKRSATTQDGEAVDDEDNGEDHEIDTTVVTLSELTTDKGLGKTSERERRMQKIDWVEVKRRQKEEADTPAAAKAASQAAAASANPEGTEESPAIPVPGGVRLRLVNGEMVVDESTTQIDRQAQAVADARNMKVIDDADLTTRTNRMSWINDKRRDEADRVPMYKMKSDPWSDAETDRFYEALGTWGTDFMMISKMFPPKTRRQIKLKFVREERLDLTRINAALMGQGVPMTIESFAEASGLNLADFKDPTIVENELRAENEKSQVEIEKKKAEAAEAQAERAILSQQRDRDTEQREEQKKQDAARRAAARAQKRGSRYAGGGSGMF